MAPRAGFCPLLRVFVGVVGAFGLLAGGAARTAAAQSSAAAVPAATDTDSPPALESVPSVTLDQYPPPSARTNLLIAGAATTAAWYGLALGSSLACPTHSEQMTYEFRWLAPGWPSRTAAAETFRTAVK